jgi:transcription elongation GreA/GreB family factor
MAKSGGGVRTTLGTGGQEVTPVQILSTTSPLGSELLGLRGGDEIEVEIRGSVREFRILAVR